VLYGAAEQIKGVRPLCSRLCPTDQSKRPDPFDSDDPFDSENEAFVPRHTQCRQARKVPMQRAPRAGLLPACPQRAWPDQYLVASNYPKNRPSRSLPRKPLLPTGSCRTPRRTSCLGPLIYLAGTIAHLQAGIRPGCLICSPGEHLKQWVFTLVELCCWDLPRSGATDRRARSWDDPDRRPSHADPRRSISRKMPEKIPGRSTRGPRTTADFEGSFRRCLTSPFDRLKCRYPGKGGMSCIGLHARW
jgi:hypothetical protein